MSSTATPLSSARRVKSAKQFQNSPSDLVGAALRHPAEQPQEFLSPPPPDLDEALLKRTHDAIDGASALIETAGHAAFIRSLTEQLCALKGSVDQSTWNNTVIPAARLHPIAGAVHECPLTWHSFSQPRGYPGDAGLLDLIYGHTDARSTLEASTAAGRAVFDFTVEVSACEAVRQRRTLLAQKIDQVAAARPDAEILAVACGHLREAELSSALKAGAVGRFVATDQDETSLGVVGNYSEAVSDAIETRKLSVKDFIAAKHGLGQFDLVYAAGLYDYLAERPAARLTRKLFSLLKPGGRLLVANFLTGIWELPYMEAYMDWHLLYRTEAQIRAFSSEISDVDLRSVSYFEDSLACIGYLELERA